MKNKIWIKIKYLRDSFATQLEKFNNADLRKLSPKMAETPLLPDCHSVMWYNIQVLDIVIDSDNPK